MKYTTDNLHIAALLMYRGFTPLDIRRDEIHRRRVLFNFPPEAKEVAATYFTGATVDAREHDEMVRRAIAMVREVQRD